MKTLSQSDLDEIVILHSIQQQFNTKYNKIQNKCLCSQFKQFDFPLQFVRHLHFD